MSKPTFTQVYKLLEIRNFDMKAMMTSMSPALEFTDDVIRELENIVIEGMIECMDRDDVEFELAFYETETGKRLLEISQRSMPLMMATMTSPEMRKKLAAFADSVAASNMPPPPQENP